MPKVRHLFHAKWRGQRITTLIARDGGDCMICGRPLDRKLRDKDHPGYITFDHIQPRSKGGRDDLRNYRLAHRLCNSVRGNDPVMPEDELGTDLAEG